MHAGYANTLKLARVFTNHNIFEQAVNGWVGGIGVVTANQMVDRHDWVKEASHTYDWKK